MPEMPEVETVARSLRRTLIGKCIVEVRLSGLPLRRPIDEAFARRLRGRVIRRIHRRGKYLIAELEPRAFWLIHLGMSGRVVHGKPVATQGKHVHAVISLSDATELRYTDHRRFGLLAAYEVPRLAQIPELRSLGVDPLSPDFHARWLHPQLMRSRREIKSFLLDQRRIAGLGNIYACEALFRARLHPGRRCGTLTEMEIVRLAKGIRGVLRAAVRHRGTTFLDFVDANGEPGDHQLLLQVFRREGRNCRRCGTIIKRWRQANRSSFYCPGCQK
jgi:formamidopyrimidine-DNA glycosylase